MTVADLEAKMTGAEFTLWAAHFNIKGMRQELADKRTRAKGGGHRGRKR